MASDTLPHRGKVFLFFWPLTRYLVTHATVALAWPLFKVLNKTVALGTENVGEEPNTVLLANHQSMIDGFLVGSAVFFPKSLIKPSLFPWFPAAYENFFAHPLLAWLSDNWKCIPVKPGRKDVGVMFRMQTCLREGIMVVFPEGTRSRDGRLLPPRSGIGYVMLQTKATAVPVCLDGMDRTLPVGRFWPRLFNTIMIYYGKPVDLSEFHSQSPSRESAEAAIAKVFERIRKMQRALFRYRRYRRYLLSKRTFCLRMYRP